jgi:hypothetical protein
MSRASSHFLARIVLAGSLVAGLTASSFAAEPRFAQPPAPVRIDRIAEIDPDVAVANRSPVTRAQVRAKLAAARAANLQRFRAYQAKAVFPNNTFEPRKLNVWLDDAGNLCAAATIISMSGKTQLVQQVAEQNNFIRLADVRQGPLMDWILTSGLTQAEIAAIQEPMMPVYRDEPVVEPDLRTAENQRLIKKYKAVEAQIVKNQKQSLESAVDRLMKNPALARSFVNS